MSAVHQPVEDGVGECRVSNVLVPVLDGELTGHERSLSAVAVLEDVEQVAPFGVGERGEPPVGSGKSAGFLPEIMAPGSVDAGSDDVSFRER